MLALKGAGSLDRGQTRGQEHESCVNCLPELEKKKEAATYLLLNGNPRPPDEKLVKKNTCKRGGVCARFQLSKPTVTAGPSRAHYWATPGETANF